MMLIRILDFETTGLTPQDAICEVGWCDVQIRGNGATVDLPEAMFINPGRPIPPQARGVHHIGDAEVAGAPSIEAGFKRLMAGPPDIFCAHQMGFERGYFSGGAVPWICTRKVSMRLWPEAPDHKNQTLRYFLNLDLDELFNPKQAMPPHRAAPDSYVTSWLFCEALKHATVEQMIAWTNQPSLLPGAIHFGKHKGTPWPQVDPTYLVWMLKQTDMDEDARFTAQHWLNRRRSDDR
jgi:exodeoxyribonuclease X